MTNQIKRVLIIVGFFTAIIFGCKKEEIRKNKDPIGNNDSLITVSEVKKYISEEVLKETKVSSIHEENFIKQLSSAIDWPSLLSVDNGKALLGNLEGAVQKNKLNTGFKKAFFYKNKQGKIEVRFIEVIPDLWHLWKYQGINVKHFSGEVFVLNKKHELESGITVQDGVVKGIIKPTKSDDKNANPEVKTLVCSWYSANYISQYGRYWYPVVYEYQVCNYFSAPVSYTGYTYGGAFTSFNHGSGRTTGKSSIPIPFLPGRGDPKITDIRNYTKCFGNVLANSAPLTITVYVQEPDYGVNSSSGLVNGIGHVCVGLSNGKTTQVIGFYPGGGPVSLISNQFVYSALRDNGTGNFHYTVSSSYRVSPGQFNSAINFLNSFSPNTYTYNLYERNCSNFVYDLCKTSGINLPSSNASGPTDRSPGQLGKDLRNVYNSTGNNSINPNGGTAPKSSGPCSN
ncbi:hypothetical protein [Rubrolithibacter danxiaensis]|uniref:hypothetical protein n=1 Tax=Rubrolithibacter danxiaensis TaxID=3390805 RepID=UPI003BF811D8